MITNTWLFVCKSIAAIVKAIGAIIALCIMIGFGGFFLREGIKNAFNQSIEISWTMAFASVIVFLWLAVTITLDAQKKNIETDNLRGTEIEDHHDAL